MNHWPFDDGRLAVLSTLAGCKTIKTACGRRVALADASHEHAVDCANCRARLTARIEANNRIRGSWPPSIIAGVKQTNAMLRAALDRKAVP